MKKNISQHFLLFTSFIYFMFVYLSIYLFIYTRHGTYQCYNRKFLYVGFNQ